MDFKANKGYQDQINAAKTKTGENDAIRVYEGKMNGIGVILSIMNFSFIGGSMGSVVGEAVSRSIVMAGEKSYLLY